MANRELNSSINVSLRPFSGAPLIKSLKKQYISCSPRKKRFKCNSWVSNWDSCSQPKRWQWGSEPRILPVILRVGKRLFHFSADDTYPETFPCISHLLIISLRARVFLWMPAYFIPLSISSHKTRVKHRKDFFVNISQDKVFQWNPYFYIEGSLYLTVRYTSMLPYISLHSRRGDLYLYFGGTSPMQPRFGFGMGAW